MKKQTATAAIVLNKKQAKKRKDGTFPVKLRITFKREYRFYAIIYRPEDADAARKEGKEPIWEPGEVISMSEYEFSKVDVTHPRELFLAKSIFLNELRNAAIKVIEKLGQNFSFDAFESGYFSAPKDETDLFSTLLSVANELIKDGKISTAITYKSTRQSLIKFTGKDKLTFDAITVTFLKDYEKWMLTPRTIKIKIKGKDKEKEKKNSRTTVSIYLRNVQTIFNKVKPIGVIYPFGKLKDGLYPIPKSRNIKKALSQADVIQIANFKAIKGTFEQRSRDYWIFSFLCNGINIKDMARLKYSNIDGDKIILVRAKTSDRVQEQTSINIPITLNIQSVIDRWGIKPALPDQYVFDILKDGMTPQDEYRAVRQAYQTINKNMTRICKQLEIDRATTYTARHSFATVLKRSGASIEFISESLGHKSKQTTMNYLADFEDAEKKKWANLLLPDTEI